MPHDVDATTLPRKTRVAAAIVLSVAAVAALQSAKTVDQSKMRHDCCVYRVSEVK
jgi:hypothetical protein